MGAHLVGPRHHGWRAAARARSGAREETKCDSEVKASQLQVQVPPTHCHCSRARGAARSPPTPRTTGGEDARPAPMPVKRPHISQASNEASP